MIDFKIILFLLAFNESFNCLKSSDFCIKPDLQLKCSGKLSYSCNDELCSSGKRICQTYINIQFLATMNNL